MVCIDVFVFDFIRRYMDWTFLVVPFVVIERTVGTFTLELNVDAVDVLL